MKNFAYLNTSEVPLDFENKLRKFADKCMGKVKRYICFFDEESICPHIPKIYYAKKGNQIVGFLSIYVFDKLNFEFCIFVHPDYRRLGIGTQLFKNFYTTQKPAFVSASVSPDNKPCIAFLNSLDFEFASTELLMRLNAEDFAVTESLIQSSLSNDFITNEDFSVSYMEDDDCFKLILDEKEVGQCFISVIGHNINRTPNYCISDVYINEDYRGRHLGSVFLYNVLSKLFDTNNHIILHVVKENVPAYNLYKKIGFKVTETSLTYEKDMPAHKCE